MVIWCWNTQLMIEETAAITSWATLSSQQQGIFYSFIYPIFVLTICGALAGMRIGPP